MCGFSRVTDTFRSDVRAFLEGAATRAVVRSLVRDDTGQLDCRPLYRHVAQRRLLAPHWPVAYGGLARTYHDAAYVYQQLCDILPTHTLLLLSVHFAGALILRHAAPHLQRMLLPDLGSGTKYATILLTEPDAGSDISAIRTRAVPDTRGVRITGTKTYCPRVTEADYGLVLARLAEPTEGDRFALIVVPLGGANVRARRIGSWSDESFGEVDFRGAFVPRDHILASSSQPGVLLSDLLALERAGVEHDVNARRMLRLLLRSREPRTRDGDDIFVTQAVARRYAGHALARAVVARIDAAQPDMTTAAMSKWYTSELAQDAAAFLITTCVVDDSEVWRSADAAVRESAGYTLSSGTSEMMLEIVGSSARPDVEARLPWRDPLLDGIQRRLREILAAPPAAWGPSLGRLSVFRLGVAPEHGGFGLGPRAGALAAYEFGRVLWHAGVEGLAVAEHCAVSPQRGEAVALLDDTLAGDARVAMIGALMPSVRWTEERDPQWLVTFDGASVRCIQRGDASLTTPFTRVLGQPVFVSAEQVKGRATSAWVLTQEELAALRRRCNALEAMYLLGAASACLAETIQYASTRHQFGRAIGENQVVRHRIATFLCELHAGYAFTRELSAGEPGTTSTESDVAVAVAADLGWRVARAALQLHGAAGMTDRTSVQRYVTGIGLEILRLGGLAAVWHRVPLQEGPGW